MDLTKRNAILESTAIVDSQKLYQIISENKNAIRDVTSTARACPHTASLFIRISCSLPIRTSDALGLLFSTRIRLQWKTDIIY